MAFIQYINRIHIGVDERRVLPSELERLGIRRPLVVSDDFLASSGLLALALDAIPPGGSPSWHVDVPANPDEAAVLRGLERYRADGCDGLVAIGGGSVLDCAKGIALLLTHGGDLVDYLASNGGEPIRRAIAPLVALPTTAGTGSEVGRGAGIVLADGRKGVFLSPHLVPAAAICDARLTASLPPGLTAGTGADAFTHAVEAFLSPLDNPPADAIALDAARRMHKALPRAVSAGQDLQARHEVMMAAVESGMTTWKGLGAAHALAMPLEDYGIHHGTAVGVLLAECVRFTLAVVETSRAALLAAALDCDVATLSDEIADFAAQIGLPKGLRDLGIPEDDLPAIAVGAAGSPFNRSAARPGTPEDYLAIARAAYD